MPGDGTYANGDTPVANYVTNLTGVRRAGGWSGKDMTHGTWKSKGQQLASCNVGMMPGAINMNYLVVQCNYNYRNTPAWFLLWYLTLDANMAARGGRVRYVKPDRLVLPGEPIFKTQKMLGSRAILSDSFSQYTQMTGNNVTGPYPGKGLYAHQEGYNALYGDWSARWYGDPQKRVMWWGQPTGKGLAFGCSTQLNGIAEWTLPDGTGGRAYDCAVGLWHQFDTASDVDVGAE